MSPMPLSLGDILALSQLAFTIAKSLSDSTGSSSEFQALIDDFQSLSKVLDNVHRVAKLEALEGTSLGKDIADHVALEVSGCRTVMEDFQRNIIKRYETALGSKATGDRKLISLRSIWYRVSWAVFKKQEVLDVRKKIKVRRDNISLLMSTYILAINQANRGPRTMGYALENAVQIRDVFGETLTLPWQLCASWEKFADILKACMKGTAGERFVNRGEYVVSLTGGKQIIKPGEWASVVRRGMQVDMSVIVRQYKRHATTQTCPRRCPGSGLRAETGGDWMICSYCNGRFPALESKGNDEEIVSPELQKERNTDGLDASLRRDGGQDGNDIQHIRNIYLIIRDDDAAMLAAAALENSVICMWGDCGIVLTHLPSLIQHINNDHIGVHKSNYTCEWSTCQRRGLAQTSRFALISHMRSHTGEIPFTCPLPECDKSFTRSYALANHMRLQHISPPVPGRSILRAAPLADRVLP